MITTTCQDICIKNSYNSLIDSTYSWQYFDNGRNTNVYKRTMFGGENMYLYGWNSTSGNDIIYRWIIGDNPNNIKSNGEIHTIKYETYNYKNLCLRPYHTSPYCMSDLSNIFGVYFGSNPLLWQNNTNVYNTINAGRPNSTIIYAFAGGLKVNDMQFIIHANALLFVYELAGSINEHENDITYEYMGEFQQYWNVHKNDYSSVMNIEYGTYRSLDDEVSRVIFGDFHIMVLAVTVMTIFLMITLGSFSCIESRPWLAVSAVLVLICSMTIGFGIGFMTGTTFNVICILVAYILLGVGVDDMSCVI